MKPFMSSYSSQIYALMRIVVGFLFLWHGTQKLFGFPSLIPGAIPAFITYIAGPIELIAGILVMIGLFTHWASFLASGQMAVAYWMAHGTKALLPIQNNGELAVLYCFVFLFISTQGSGSWSIDALRNIDRCQDESIKKESRLKTGYEIEIADKCLSTARLKEVPYVLHR